ncbi:Hpt domain-containing protein [Adlercreutzia agrestimuris]|uniref:Hpt domain-containing protein n=1 Tax=Adlercreutzia agrestimuris TaxID=2941324 RepID=UPI00203CB880|nr:Hpt domain-containing protein [Adlercreutzia agrestimuris]
MAELSDFSESTIINYEEAMDRFGGNKELYMRLASKFADDPHHARLKEALADSDIETAYRAAHSLKGVAGNLSFTDLYTVATRVSDALHSADVATALQNMDELDSAYDAVKDALASLNS